jgi:hypothetical protein
MRRLRQPLVRPKPLPRAALPNPDRDPAAPAQELARALP